MSLLDVEVYQRCRAAQAGKGSGEVDGDGRRAHAAARAQHGDAWHKLLLPGGRCLLECAVDFGQSQLVARQNGRYAVK